MMSQLCPSPSPSHSPSRPPSRLPSPSSLFVTALYDLPRLEKNTQRRPIETYLNDFQFITQQQDIHLLVFTESHLFLRIQEQCKTHPHVTIIVREFSELALTAFQDKIEANHRLHPYVTDNPSKDTTSFFIVCCSKFEFVYSAARMFPAYDQYIWLDAGIKYIAAKTHPNLSLKQFAAALDNTKFCCTLINPISSQEEYDNLQEYCSKWRYRQVGGCWSVGRQIILPFFQCLYEELTTILTRGYKCADEDIMARFVWKYPQLCTFSFGDYQSCISNWLGLFEDFEVAKYYITQAHARGVHHVATAGTAWLINEQLSKGSKDYSLPIICHYLLQLYIEMYYIEKSRAKEIALFFCDIFARCYELSTQRSYGRTTLDENNSRNNNSANTKGTDNYNGVLDELAIEQQRAEHVLSSIQGQSDHIQNIFHFVDVDWMVQKNMISTLKDPFFRVIDVFMRSL